MQFFNIDGPIFTALSKIADLFLLNLLFILCSLPIITIGASMSALYTVTLKMVRDREGPIFSSFLKAFRENFKKSTLIWLLLLGIFLLGVLNLRIISITSIPFASVFYIGSIILLFMTFLIMLFAFPLAARFENSIPNTLRNSFLLEALHLPYTICIVLISIVPTICILFVPLQFSIIYAFWIFFGFSTTAFANSFIFEYKIFRKLMTSEEWE